MKQFSIIVLAILAAVAIIAGVVYVAGMDGSWHRQVDRDIADWNSARDQWAGYEQGQGFKEIALDAAKKLVADSKANPPWSELTPNEKSAISNAEANFNLPATVRDSN